MYAEDMYTEYIDISQQLINLKGYNMKPHV